MTGRDFRRFVLFAVAGFGVGLVLAHLLGATASMAIVGAANLALAAWMLLKPPRFIAVGLFDLFVAALCFAWVLA